MPAYHEVATKTDLGTELTVIIPPRELDTRPRRVITAQVSGRALADLKVQLGPTQDGPWFDEDLSSAGLPTLAAEHAGVYRMDKIDRFLQIQAKAAAGEEQCDLTVWLDADI